MTNFEELIGQLQVISERANTNIKSLERERNYVLETMDGAVPCHKQYGICRLFAECIKNRNRQIHKSIEEIKNGGTI